MGIVVEQYRSGSGSSWKPWTTTASMTEDKASYFTSSNNANNYATVFKLKVTPGNGYKVTKFTFTARVSLYTGGSNTGIYAFLTDPSGNMPMSEMPSGYIAQDIQDVGYQAAFKTFTFTGLDIQSDTYIYLWVRNESSMQPDRIYIRYNGQLAQAAITESVAMQSTPTVSKTSCAIGDTMQVLTNRAGAYYHKLSYSFEGVQNQTAGLSASTGIETSATFTPPESLASQIPNAASGTLTFTLKTYSDRACTQQIGIAKYVQVTITVPDSMGPAVSAGWASAVYYNSGTPAENIAGYVQGYSKAQVNFDSSKVTTRYGAQIAGYSITCRGVTKTSAPYLTNVLQSSATITCTVTDTRGKKKSGTISVTVMSYHKPVLNNAIVYRCDAQGEASSAGSFLYANSLVSYSELGGLNAITLKGYFKARNGNYNTGTEFNNGDGDIIAAGISAAASYVGKIEAVDRLGNRDIYEVVIPTDSVAFSLRPGGIGAAFGKYSELDHVLELPDDWDIKFQGSMLSDLIAGGGASYADADGMEF